MFILKKIYWLYSIIGLILLISFMGGFLYEFYTDESFKERLIMRERPPSQSKIDPSFLVNRTKTEQNIEYSEDLAKVKKFGDWLLLGSLIIWFLNIRQDFVDFYNKKIKKYFQD